MMNSVAPVWDGNETWLVLGWCRPAGAFPLVYSVYLPALYIGVFLLLAGLIFRGVAFEFRFKASSGSRKYWNWAFFRRLGRGGLRPGSGGGRLYPGLQNRGLVYVGGPLDWLTPFTVLTGLGLVTGYALLGLCLADHQDRGHTPGLGLPHHAGAAGGGAGGVCHHQPLDARVVTRRSGSAGSTTSS
jgi:cytochrome bd ubiquinol oxidase subunit II